MGCVGEIAIAGHSLARGYLNNDTLSRKHFVEAPQLTNGLISSCIYLTGDTGRYEFDGKIRIIGRKDRRIKVNGVRVDPGESKNQLRQLGGKLAPCMVQCVYDEQLNAKLAAFIQGGPAVSQKPIDQGLIVAEERTPAFLEMCQFARRHLQKLLPQEYIPTMFVPITNVPYTMSNKLDLKRLRDELQQIPNFPSVFGINPGNEEHSLGKIPSLPQRLLLRPLFARFLRRSVNSPRQRTFSISEEILFLPSS